MPGTFDGNCELCPEIIDGEASFLFPDAETKTTCQKVECNDFEYLNDKGECVNCDKGFYVDANGKQCIHKKCHDVYQILTPAGECTSCVGTEFPDAMQRKCIPMGCSQHEYLNSEGNCIECSGRFLLSGDVVQYNYPDAERRSCQKVTCTPDEGKQA